KSCDPTPLKAVTVSPNTKSNAPAGAGFVVLAYSIAQPSGWAVQSDLLGRAEVYGNPEKFVALRRATCARGLRGEAMSRSLATCCHSCGLVRRRLHCSN